MKSAHTGDIQGMISLLLTEIVSILNHERENCTRCLEHVPPGRLRIETSNGKTRYLHSVRSTSCLEADLDSGAGMNRKPSRSEPHRYKRTVIKPDSPLFAALAAKEYARSALEILDHDLRILSGAMQKLRDYTQDAVVAGMRPAYQALPREVFTILAQDDTARLQQHQWAQASYERSDHLPHHLIHTTSRGLKVRSRAELLIAELLYKYEIPFRYEQVLHAGKYTFAPDFTFLDRDGNEFYWEYCGMMDDPEYRQRQLWRRSVYESLDMTEWNNMIYTYDGADGIDVREIEAIIRTKILPRL